MKSMCLIFLDGSYFTKCIFNACDAKLPPGESSETNLLKNFLIGCQFL